jgi:hypothetical protein
MANEIYADQLLHLIGRVALESYATGITGLERLGVKAPDLETLLGDNSDSPATYTEKHWLKSILTAISTTNDKDFATQTTLAAVLTKIIAAPATEAKQDTAITALADILAKLSADPATQTTLANVLAALQGTLTVTNANLDIALSVLRDAIIGSSAKTMTDIVTALTGYLKQVIYNSSGTEIGTETNPIVIKIGNAGIVLPVDIQAVLRSMLVTYTTALAASGTYTSSSFDCINRKTVTGTVYADQAGTLNIQQSRDGSTYRSLTTIAVVAGTPQGFSVPVYSRYVRANYVNGATAQGAFELTMYDAPN